MSGSNSSVRDAAPPEALSFTVHSVQAPDLEIDRRRTRSGRLKMLLVLLACALPVLASYFTYFVVRPEGRSNYGTLIQPTRSLPALALRNLSDETLPATSLRGQWLLVTVAPAACGSACESRLYMQRQLREMLGRDRDRLDKVWFVTDNGTPPPALVQALTTGPAPAKVVRAEREALARWLEPEPGRALEDHLYLVDPLGEWMMRFPADADPKRVKRDLERLLRAASFWDQAGR